MELLNEPVEFLIAGKTIKFRRISSAKKRAIAQSLHLKLMMAHIKEKASALFPDDEKERQKYVSERIREIPEGLAFVKLIESQPVIDELVDRYMAESSGLPYDEIVALVDEATADELSPVLAFLAKGKKK